MRKKNPGIRSRLYSFKYAFDGLISLLKNEPNSRIHLVMAILVIVLGFILPLSISEWLIIIMVTGLVFITELINSSIEQAADIIEPEQDPKVKMIKDYAAAAVLVSAIVAVITGGLIFIPKLIDILN